MRIRLSVHWFVTVLVCFGLQQASLAFEVIYVGESTAPLDNPHDVKLSPDGTKLLVSDVGNDRVVILDARTLELMGAFGSDEQDGTHDVDFDARGRLYVADTHNHQTLIYDFNGMKASLRGALTEKIRKPEGVLAHPNGRIYVAGAGSNNVVAYADGKVVASAEGFRSPHDLEAAPNGDVWLADAGNDRLVRLDQSLATLEALSGPTYGFAGPRYMDILPDGTLIIADKYTHTLKVVDTDRRLIATLGDGNPGKGRLQFTTPEGVETDATTLWIADSGNDRIVMYRWSSQ